MLETADKPELEEPSRPSLVGRLSDMVGSRPAVGSLAQAGLLLIATFFVLYTARAVFVPFAFALMFYFLLRPLVRALTFRLFPRALASAVVLLGLVALLCVSATQAVQPAAEWAARLPQVLRNVERRSEGLRGPMHRVSDLASRLERVASVSSDEDTSVRAVSDKPRLFDELLAVSSELVAAGLITLFALYFLLVNGDSLLERLLRLLPDVRERERAQAVMAVIERRMGRYLGTATLINFGLGSVLGLCLQAIGMPNPWLWGAIAMLLNYVPYLGPALGMCIVGLAGFAIYPTLSQALVPAAIYLALATVEGNVLTPFILGRAFHISPLVVFGWLVFWGWLWSVPGAIVAVPLLMLLNITCEQSPTLRPIAALMRG